MVSRNVKSMATKMCRLTSNTAGLLFDVTGHGESSRRQRRQQQHPDDNADHDSGGGSKVTFADTDKEEASMSVLDRTATVQ
jgi:hypothetical protein